MAMTPQEIYDKVCGPGFKDIKRDLHGIDEKLDKIQGTMENHNIRIDRMEQRTSTISKIIWIAIAAIIAVAINSLFLGKSSKKLKSPVKDESVSLFDNRDNAEVAKINKDW